MKSDEIYQAIYDAAKNRDERALSEALNQGPINVLQKINHLVISPVGQLALENDQKAVSFLLSKRASIDDAVEGYAIGGHTDEVKKLLKKGASIDDAVRGYAMGGHTDQVTTLLGEDASKDDAVRGYAMNGYTDQVTDLISRGASKDDAVKGYDRGRYPYEKDFIDLFQGIYALNQYGETLKKEGSSRTGKIAITLAEEIRKQVKLLEREGKTDEISNKLSEIITNGKKAMGEDRKAKDIIAHIVLALTGIGLLIIIGKKLATGSVFLNSTKRQEMLRSIDQEIKAVKKKS